MEFWCLLKFVKMLYCVLMEFLCIGQIYIPKCIFRFFWKKTLWANSYKSLYAAIENREETWELYEYKSFLLNYQQVKK